MLEVQLLGHLALADSGHRVEAVRNPRLIAYLLLNRDRPIERTEVAFTLWPDSSDAQALTNLRRELHALRRALPDAERLLAIERRTIRWRPDGPFHLDVAAFEDAVEHAAGGGVDGLRAAVAMYRGDLLPGIYDDWIEPHRDHLRTKMIETLDALATGLEDRREYRAAMEQLSRLVAIDPPDRVPVSSAHACCGPRRRSHGGPPRVPRLRQRIARRARDRSESGDARRVSAARNARRVPTSGQCRIGHAGPARTGRPRPGMEGPGRRLEPSRAWSVDARPDPG